MTYGPPDASKAPRYTGVRTFARCPLVDDPAGVDVGAVGIPFDTATSQRTPARTAAQIAGGLSPIVAAGTVPIVLGGDHSIVLGELRAHAARHGPLSLLLLDGHADTWGAYYGGAHFAGAP